MTWEYRVIRRKFPSEDGNGLDEAFWIYRVSYSENGDPVEVSTVEPPPNAEDVESLRAVLTRMARAFDNPILNYEDFGDDGYVPDRHGFTRHGVVRGPSDQT